MVGPKPLWVNKFTECLGKVLRICLRMFLRMFFTHVFTKSYKVQSINPACLSVQPINGQGRGSEAFSWWVVRHFATRANGQGGIVNQSSP